MTSLSRPSTISFLRDITGPHIEIAGSVSMAVIWLTVMTVKRGADINTDVN